MLFTFVTEVAGSTIVEQSDGSNVVDAVRRWVRSSAFGPEFNEDVVDIDATPVSGVADVWCVSGLTKRGDFFISHVIATVVRGEHQRLEPAE